MLPLLLGILAPSAGAAGTAKDADKDKDKDKEDKDRLARQRPVLRIVAELALVHAWPEGVGKGVTEVSKVLKNLVSCLPQVVHRT